MRGIHRYRAPLPRFGHRAEMTEHRASEVGDTGGPGVSQMFAPCLTPVCLAAARRDGGEPR